MLRANMPDGYSKEQLMEIAILSDVDGIIVEGDDSEKLITLIAEAEENGIPVVTVMSDADKSRRKSFIGISSYDVGIEFGKQLINYLDSDKGIENIMILLGSGDAYSSQHTMYLGILECISQYSQCVIDVKLLDNTTAFSTDEAIRDILVNLEEIGRAHV